MSAYENPANAKSRNSAVFSARERCVIGCIAESFWGTCPELGFKSATVQIVASCYSYRAETAGGLSQVLEESLRRASFVKRRPLPCASISPPSIGFCALTNGDPKWRRLGQWRVGNSRDPRFSIATGIDSETDDHRAIARHGRCRPELPATK